MYENTPNNPTNPRPGYGLHEPQPHYATNYGKGWLWVAGAAVLVLLALFMFGGTGGDTSIDTVPAADAPRAIEQPAPPASGVVPAAPPAASE